MWRRTGPLTRIGVGTEAQAFCFVGNLPTAAQCAQGGDNCRHPTRNCSAFAFFGLQVFREPCGRMQGPDQTSKALPDGTLQENQNS